MLILVSGSTKTVGRLAVTNYPHLGHLLTPANRNSVASIHRTGLRFGVDNGAFSGFDAEAFRRLLRRVAGQPGLLWVVCPDVVGDAAATIHEFSAWAPELRTLGVPIAFVAQDGQEKLPCPWEDFDALFVGGSTAWKESASAADLVQAAKSRGKWVHMGRVNSRRRLAFAIEIGCDSVDGSSLSKFGDKYIHKFIAWAKQLEQQPLLPLE